ncbi:MAG: HupE/UreJ family protein [Gammaproteobacteria bacterium]
MNKELNLMRYPHAFIALFLILSMEPAFAHHMMGGALPSNNFQGFISGVAHPIIGLDHLAFIVAIGLLATLIPGRSYLIPVVFVLATIGGTAIHLAQVSVAYNEAVVAVSVIAAGFLLLYRSLKSTAGLLLFCAISGVSHGYAYGEAIVGAETAPLVAYLAGFCTIQLSIAIGVYLLFSASQTKKYFSADRILRFSGITISVLGAAVFAVSN